MEYKCLEFNKLSDDEIAALPILESTPAFASLVAAVDAASAPKPGDKKLDKSQKSTDSSSESSEPELSEDDLGEMDDEHPEHRSLCCKCCKLKFKGDIRMINWPFLICMTLATVLAGMSIGSALFNDGPISNIV